jgi:hypothetical protein
VVASADAYVITAATIRAAGQAQTRPGGQSTSVPQSRKRIVSSDVRQYC